MLLTPDRPIGEPRAAASRGAGGRYRSQDWRSRLFGVGGTAVLCLIGLACVFAGIRAVQSFASPPAPLLVELLPLAAPPEPVQEVPEGEEKVEQKEQREQVAEKEQIVLPDPIVPMPAQLPVRAEKPVEQARATEAVAETTAPKSVPAPPAPRAASNAERTWEALLMAHLEKHRRYPAAARARREQGAASVRFRMNRAGRVLSVALVQSSGSAALDRAALETIRRAEPLPAIPDDRPDTLELALPIEFFLRR